MEVNLNGCFSKYCFFTDAKSGTGGTTNCCFSKEVIKSFADFLG